MNTVPFRRVAWRPRITVVGVVGGAIGAVGAVVFLQQAGAIYPTSTVMNGSVLAGVLVGIGLPSLMRFVAVRRINNAVTRVQARTSAPGPATSWHPTHVVPPAGLSSWMAPDASGTITPIDPGVEVVVLEQRGDWAHIRCLNDWEAWVDARQLVPVAAGAGT